LSEGTAWYTSGVPIAGPGWDPGPHCCGTLQAASNATPSFCVLAAPNRVELIFDRFLEAKTISEHLFYTAEILFANKLRFENGKTEGYSLAESLHCNLKVKEKYLS
jgi:hypothetical protein